MRAPRRRWAAASAAAARAATAAAGCLVSERRTLGFTWTTSSPLSEPTPRRSRRVLLVGIADALLLLLCAHDEALFSSCLRFLRPWWPRAASAAAMASALTWDSETRRWADGVRCLAPCLLPRRLALTPPRHRLRRRTPRRRRRSSSRCQRRRFRRPRLRGDRALRSQLRLLRRRQRQRRRNNGSKMLPPLPPPRPPLLLPQRPQRPLLLLLLLPRRLRRRQIRCLTSFRRCPCCPRCPPAWTSALSCPACSID